MSLNIGRDLSELIPVLGLFWNKDDDNVFCDTAALKLLTLDNKKKRFEFNSLNFRSPWFLSPATLIAKLFIQRRTWKLDVRHTIRENFLPGMGLYTISLSFVCEKSQLATLRKTTIPRLELLACYAGQFKKIQLANCCVVNIYLGKDNQVRVVKVKTKAGELIRPVKKLYLLELSSLT
ncbi:hypothetical protein NPIL_247291 [Nephila pilipes]|uniref:DUF5641 domain-containing protein n=1 Tax=Nephila pilipes TaxID=299642 RepID=A0A8X6QGQ4_NEPPI|nr:hypothetical protein NPIL_247291 [Nephila pilipes]